MALEDQIGAVDPQEVVGDLISQHQPSFAQYQAVDPQAVLNRLIRSHGAPRPRRDEQPRQPAQPQTPKPFDSGAYGKPTDSKVAPFSSDSYGEEVLGGQEPEAPWPTQKPAPWVSAEGASVLGREAAQAAVTSTGEAIKGIPTLQRAAEQIEAEHGPAMAEVPVGLDFTPEEKAARQEAAQTRLGRTEEHPLYKAGKAVESWGKEKIPVSEEERARHPLASMTGRFAGGALPAVGGGLAAGAVGGPVAGIAAGAGIMAAQSAGSEFERAKTMYFDAAKTSGMDDTEADRYSDEKAAKSAGLSAVIMGTTGTLPIGVILAPAKTMAPGIVGRLWAMLDHGWRSGVTFAGVGEAQQWLGEQLAKSYDPGAKYEFDFKRLVAEFLAGGALGAGHTAFQRRPAQPQQQTGQQPGAQATGAQPQPQPQPQPGIGGGTAGAQNTRGGNAGARGDYWKWTDPATGREYYTDDTGRTGAWDQRGNYYDNWDFQGYLGAQQRGQSQQQQQGQQQQAGAGAQQQPPPPGEAARAEWQKQWESTPPPTPEEVAKFAKQKEAFTLYNQQSSRTAAKGLYSAMRGYGFTDEELSNANTKDMRDYVRDGDILSRHGHTRDEIGRMSPQQMRDALDEAQSHDASFAEEPAAEGTRENPTQAETAEDVRTAASAASQDHSPAQGEANNARRGHTRWNGLDITIEAPAGGVRRGKAPDGTDWEQKFTHDYGYIKGTAGADGDHADVFMGPHPDSPLVFVLDELDPKTGKYRQTKSFLGFHTPDQAVQAYLGASGKSHEQIGGMAAFGRDEFVDLAKSGGLAKPVAYKEAQATPEHKQAVEDVVRGTGENPADLEPPDLVDRAAELHATHGLSPQDAVQAALLKAAIEHGVFTDDQVQSIYGKKIASLLSAIEPSQRRIRPSSRSSAARGETAPAAAGEELGAQLPHGGKGGEGGKPRGEAGGGEREAAAAGHPETGTSAAVRPAAGGERVAEADAGRAGGKAAGGRATEHKPAEPAAKAPVKRKYRTLSLVQFIADRGGIDSSDPLIKDVQAIIGRNNLFVPGFGPLIRKGGMGLDHAREAAVEAKYIHDIGAISEAPATSTINTLLEHLENEIRGSKHYPAGEEPDRQEPDWQREQGQEREAQIEAAKERIAKVLKQRKLEPEYFIGEHLDRAAHYVAFDGIEPLAAIEKVGLELEREESMVSSHDDDYIDLGDYDVASQRHPAPEESEGAAPESAALAAAEERPRAQAGGAAPSAGPGTSGRPESRPAGGAGEHQPSGGATEQTAAGQQHVLPGAERISDAELAKRRAGERLKPKVGQRPADEGLFGDQSQQTDLVDLAGKPADEIRMQRYLRSVAVGRDRVTAELRRRGFPDASDQHLYEQDSYWLVQYITAMRDGTDRSEAVAMLHKRGIIEFLPGEFRDKNDKTIGFMEGDNLYVIEPHSLVDGKEDWRFRELTPEERTEGDTSQQTDLVEQARKPPPKAEDGFDEAAFDAREKAIKESAQKAKAEGKTLVADLPYGVEAMRGVRFRSVRDDTTGVILTVSNRNDIVVHWDKDAGTDETWEARKDASEWVVEGRAEVTRKNDKWVIKEPKAAKSTTAEAPKAPEAGPENVPYDEGERWWENELTAVGRAQAIKQAGLKTTRGVRWKYLTADERISLLRTRKEAEKAPEAGPDFAFVPNEGWRDHLIKARVYANALKIDHRGMDLDDIVKAIDAKLPQDEFGDAFSKALDDEFGEKPEAKPKEPAPPALSVDQASVALEAARATHLKIKRRLDALDAKLEGEQPKPRNALDKERLDRIREFQERIARSMRKKEAAAMDAVDDAKAALKAAKEAPRPTVRTPAAEPPRAPRPAEPPSGEMPDIPPSLVRKPRTPQAPPIPGTAPLGAKAKPSKSAADDAMAGLTALFGKKKKPPSGLSAPESPFGDDETYSQAKPLFIAAAEKFPEHKDNIADLVRAMVRELRQSHGWDREMLQESEPYFRRFIADVKSGEIDLAARTDEPNIKDTGEGEPDEYREPKAPGEKTLGGVAPGEGEGAEGGGDTERDPTRGGGGGSEGNRPSDEHRLPGARGGRGGAPDDTSAAGGGRGNGGATRGGRGGRGRIPKAPAPDVAPHDAPNIPATNYTITDETELGKGSEGVKFRDNIAAIETLKRIEREERRATPEEQRLLARYVGWGGLANSFRDPEGNLKPDWKDRGEELESLLSNNEYRAARRSTRNAHYTSKPVIDAMWNAVRRLGFRGGLSLELSAGSGNFIGLMPKDLAGKFIAVEYDSITARIAKALYPQETVLHAGLQQVPLPDGEAVLNIGNPPFGAEGLRFQYKPELNHHSIHNQFFLAGLDALRPGGIQALVVSRYLMDAQSASAREELAKKGKLLGAIRLPDTAFKENARTEVVTDILFLQRHTPAEEKEIGEAFDAAETLRRGKKADIGDAYHKRHLEKQAAKIPSWVETGKIKDPLGGDDMEVNKYFVKNPHMIMGRLERSGTMRTHEEINVKLDKNIDLSEMLNKAVERLPKNVIDLDKEVMDATLARHKTLSESLAVALAGHEVGHVEFGPDGKLTQIAERETTKGDWEVTKRPVTPESPWSRHLLMDKDGKWYTLEPQSKADALRDQLGKVKLAYLEYVARGQGYENTPQAKTLKEQADEIENKLIPEAEKSGEKAKTVVGKRNIYERKYFPNNEVPANMRLGKEKFDRLSDMVKLRDLTKKQLTYEAEDAPADVMEGNRRKLATAYKAYVDKHGLLNERSTASLASDLPDGALIMALETAYRAPITVAKAARTGEAVRRASATPAPILSRRVVPKYEPATRAESPADALSISLSERGRVDMGRIASLLGIDEAQAAEKLSEGDKPLVYRDPETNTWEKASDYLSGLVARKINAARNAGLDKNVTALEKVLPARWDAQDVTPIMGSSWIPPETYTQFIDHLLGGHSPVSYSKATNAFHFFVDDNADKAKLEQWSVFDEKGRMDMPADAILRGVLNSRVPKVVHEDSDGKKWVDKEATALVQLKAREIENEFADWVYRDPDRRNQIVDIFNDKFNTRTNRQHDGSHLTLPGKVPDAVIKMRRHQLNAIWRGIYERFVLYDHVVGSGKTFTAIARAMERRRMGLSKKPMIVVPNHLIDQWTQDVYRLYPGAKVLAAKPKQLDSKNRRRLFARIATGDWDIVIVPHSSFHFIGVAPETEMRFLDEELRVAREAVQDAADEAASSGAGGFRKPFTVKEAERLVTTIENRIDTLKNAKRERMLTFEQMGIDDLTVDEAHVFKNLFYSSRLADVRGMGDKHGSKRAFDLYTKVRVMRESPTGSVAFLTGTPISNSAVEMYTMMRYLAAQELKDLGLEHFDAWRTQSVSAASKWEPTESGSGLKEVTRLGRAWSNMRNLMNLWYSFTDAVPQEDINRWYAEDNNGAPFPVPPVKNGGRKEVIVKPTSAQLEILEQVIAGFDGLPHISDPDERNAERLRLMDRARKVSLDARAVDPLNPSAEEGGKLEVMADNIARIYKQWTKDAGTQLVFLDRGVPKSRGDAKIIKEYDALLAKRDAALAANDEDAYRTLVDKLEAYNPHEIEELRRAQAGGWNAYDQLKQNLIKRGISANEIRFVQEANTPEEKQALFDTVNDGKTRVLIGSTERMGAGTNVQERIVGLHHGDVTWKPSDIEQREGRIIRQGNKLLAKYGKIGHNGAPFEVEILAYATERTVDAKMWDLNSTKLKMVNGIRKYDGSFNMEFEDEDSVSMAEMAALASGDPLLLERVKLAAEIDKLELLERAHKRKMFGIEDAISAKQRIIRDYPGLAEQTETRAKELQTELRAVSQSANKRSVTVEGKPFSYEDSFGANREAFQTIERQQSGNDKAKYSVNVDGKPFTSKAAIEDAIHAALGDARAFEATVDGQTLTRRAQMAHVLYDQINPLVGSMEKRSTKSLDIGTMLNGDLQVTVEKRDKYFDINIALTRNGRTLAANYVNGEEYKDGYSLQAGRGLIERLEGDIHNVARSTGDYYREKVEEAKHTLPPLLGQTGQPFKNQAELNEKRGRLEAVIRELDARTKAAEQRHGQPAAEEEEADPGASGLSAPSSPFPATGEILSPRSLSTQTAPELRARLKELENQQRSLMQLRPMVSTLIKLGVTPEQMMRMTPPEAYQFIKARSPQGMGKVDRDADKVIEETIDKIREQRAAVTDALLIEQGLSAPSSPFPAPSVGPVSHSGLPHVRVFGELQPPHASAFKFAPDPSRPLGEQAQSHVLTRGLDTGVEHVVAVDQDGKVVGDLKGTSDHVAFTSALERVLADPAEAVVIHHNHPSGHGTVSIGDVAALGRPGFKAIWAHGDKGTVSRAELTDEAKTALARFPDIDTRIKAISTIIHEIDQKLITNESRALGARRITMEDIEFLHHQVRNLILHDAGLIDLHHNIDIGDYIEKAGLTFFMQRAASAIRQAFFNEPATADATRRPDRRPGTLSHRGDLGTSLGRPEDIARQHREGIGGRAGREAYRAAQANAGAGLSAPYDPFFRHNQPPAEEHLKPEDYVAESRAPLDYVPPPKHPSLGFLGDPRQTVRSFKKFWTSTFQPELVSDRAFEADPLFARYKSAQAQEKDALIRQSESEWNYWNKRSDAERIRFIDDLETAGFGWIPSDPVQAAMARRYRAMLDANWAEEKRYGSQAAFVEDYFPHIWEKPEDWRKFSQARSAQVGPTWFQKKRTIDYITEGLAAGLKLRYTNPVDIIVHRLSSGVDMRQRMELLFKLKDMGLAWEGKQGGDQLAARGWQLINAPDRKQWVIHPDVQLLWKNAVEAKGFWQAEHVGGSMFRGWMALKNAWIPVKLALSAFHPLHVLHINWSNGMARGIWDEGIKGRNPVEAAKAIAEGFYGPIAAAIPGMPHQGKAARTAWSKRPSQQSNEDKAIVALMNDGGFVPQLSEQLKIAAKRQLAEAYQKILRGEAGAPDWRKFVSAALRRPIEILQAPIFEKWIPTIKASAYLNQAATLLRRRPDLLTNDTQRRIALRAISKSIDNRFGEMFYGTLFWNRYTKDTAVGSFLSLGWQLGFIREYPAAVIEAVTRPAGVFPSFRPSEGRRTARDATNKIANALIYMGGSALILGMMSYLFSGKQPEGIDWIFPRIGGENPDGSPRRITHMSYLREFPMLLKHVQERGGNWLTGTGEMLWNKLMFEPFKELLQNRDYYGYNIWDENAPIYKQVWQGIKHFIGEQTNPMSISGAKRAAEISGKPFKLGEPSTWLESATAKGVGMSVLGFGPAPAYAEKSEVQNRIAYLYHEHVLPSSQPEEKGEQLRERQGVRSAILIARRDHDSKALQEAYKQGRAVGMTPQQMNSIGRMPSDVYMFKRLPDADQKAILEKAGPGSDDYKRYFKEAHEKVKQEFFRRARVPRTPEVTSDLRL